MRSTQTESGVEGKSVQSPSRQDTALTKTRKIKIVIVTLCCLGALMEKSRIFFHQGTKGL